MFCGSSSRCLGLVCSVCLWYFLIKLTFFLIDSVFCNHVAASDLGLNCLPMSHKKTLDLILFYQIPAKTYVKDINEKTYRFFSVCGGYV